MSRDRTDTERLTVYISGPMTGLPEYNYPAFAAAAEAWRDLGHTVLSPHEAFGGDKGRDYHDYIREDVRMLVQCDAIALLPGWERSRGARLELHVAQMMGCAVYSALTFVPLDVPQMDALLAPAAAPPSPGTAP